MAPRIGDDLQVVEASAIGEGEGFVENDRLASAWARLGLSRATGRGVCAAVVPPAPRVLVISRSQQVEDRLGAIALARSHGLRHILVAEDVAFPIAWIVLDKANGGPDLPRTGRRGNALNGGIVDAHADERRAQHLRDRV